MRAGMSIALLPNISEPGPQNIGPNTYPRRKTVVIRYETSLDVPNACSTKGEVTDADEDAYVLSQTQ
jgi:hypothetical protein